MKKKRERFHRMVHFLVSFFGDRINCARDKHKWVRRKINFELDGQIMASQMGYACSVCGRYVRDFDIIEEKTNAPMSGRFNATLH